MSKQNNHRPYTWFFLRIRPLFRLLTKLRGDPEAIAGGFALGFFIAFTPTVGVQVLLAVFLATLFKVSRPASLVPIWITNPLTVPPIFTFNYWVGSLIWPGPSVSEVYGHFLKIASKLTRLDMWELTSIIDAFAVTGKDVLGPLILGSFIVATFAGIMSYLLFYRIFKFLSERRAKKKLRTAKLNN